MSTLIRGGTVVTGSGDTVMEGGAVVIRDGRIADVLGHWDADRQFDGEIMDAQGCVVMPGLINSHAHGVTPVHCSPVRRRPCPRSGGWVTWTGTCWPEPPPS